MLLPLLIGCASGDRSGARGDGADPAADEILVLTPAGGAYHAFSQLLAGDLAARLAGEYRVRLLTGTRDGDAISGSMDVLDAMARRSEGPAHYLGLSQSDVAYHFRYGGHPMYEVPHVHRDRLAALAKTFPETLYLYSSVAPPPVAAGGEWEFDDFQALWQSLYLGELGSGTLITTYNVFPILSPRPLGTPPPGLRQHRRGPPVDAADTSGAGAGDFGAALVSSLAQNPLADRLAERGGTLIPLSSSQQRHLASVYSAFYRAGRQRDPRSVAAGDDGGALGVEIPALLVADRALPEAAARAVFAFLAELDADPAGFARRVLASGNGSAALDAANLRHLLAAFGEYRAERYADLILPAHRTLLDLPAANYLPPLVLAALFLALFVLLVRGCLRSMRSGAAWLEIPSSLVFGVAVALTLLWFHACLAAVMVLERRAYLAYEVDTPSLFIERSYVDLLPGLMHYTASGFSMQELIPQAYVAQLVWLSIPFVLALSVLGGTLHVAVPPLVRYLSRTLKGEITLRTDGHILFLHWHPYAAQVIRQLAEHARLERREAQRFLVVSPDRAAVEVPAIAERTDAALGPYTLHATTAGSEGSRMIDFAVLERDPKAEETLELVGLERARFVVVFPVPGHPEPDSVTVILLLRMQQLLAALEEAARPKVLVWAQDPANVPLLMDERLGAADVCSMEWAWRVLCQTTYVDAVSNVYRRLMVDTADSEELYELVLPDDWRPRPFRTLLEEVWRYNAEAAERLEENGRRNIVTLVGMARRDDRRKAEVELCPEPERPVGGGDRLLIITYQLDAATRGRLLGRLAPGPA